MAYGKITIELIPKWWFPLGIFALRAWVWCRLPITEQTVKRVAEKAFTYRCARGN